MSGYNPLPPYTLHHSTRLTHAEAHTFLSTFLEQANNNAAYRPDSTLTEDGPQSSSSATKSDLTLHNLNRIQLGLEGKRLGVEDLENGFLGSSTRKRKRDDGNMSDALSSSMPTTPGADKTPKAKASASRSVLADMNEDPTSSGPAVVSTVSDNDWQDKGDYELAQDDEDIDMNNAQRDPGAGLPQPGNEEEAEEMVEIEVEGTGKRVDPRTDTPTSKIQIASDVSKEERKRLKKERAQEEKRKREADKLKKK